MADMLAMQALGPKFESLEAHLNEGYPGQSVIPASKIGNHQNKLAIKNKSYLVSLGLAERPCLNE